MIDLWLGKGTKGITPKWQHLSALGRIFINAQESRRSIPCSKRKKLVTLDVPCVQVGLQLIGDRGY